MVQQVAQDLLEILAWAADYVGLRHGWLDRDSTLVRKVIVDLPTPFLSTGVGRVLGLGAGSGRATVGVDDRVQIEVADMRTLPFAANSFDAAISVAAIDHLRWDDVEQALSEVARVLEPAGQLLIVSLDADGWVRIAMPWSLHGGGFWGSSPNRERWRSVLDRCGFDVTEVGMKPATLYFLATKRR